LEVIVNDEDGYYFVEHAVERKGIDENYGTGNVPDCLRALGRKILESRDMVGKWYD
jgi:hypothetical protein